MEVVVGTHNLGLGGSETYALTLAEQLGRLGHRVVVVAALVGDGLHLARERGVEVRALDAYRGGRCDAIVAQDAGMAFELGARHPAARLVFVAHSEEFDEQLPPRLAGLVDAVVVLNERVERRVRALAGELPVTRLRQPIDVSRFRPRSRPGLSPRRLLVLGNNLDGPRLDLVAGVAAEGGLELAQAGAKGGPTATPEDAIGAADIVMGYGRCALEAMACGRPTYVYDHLGGDGWVTPATYPALERDGFGGRAHDTTIDRDRLLADLRGYDAGMGLVNRDLVVAHHRAEHHAQRFVALFETLGAAGRARGSELAELAILVREQWAARGRIDHLEARVVLLQDQLMAERRAAATAAAAEKTLRRTRRYRLGSLLARPLDVARSGHRKRS